VETSDGELCHAEHKRPHTCARLGQMVGNQIAVFVHWDALMQALAREEASSNVAANNREALEREMRRLHVQADHEHWIARMARRTPGEITWQLFMPALLAFGFGGSLGLWASGRDARAVKAFLHRVRRTRPTGTAPNHACRPRPFVG